MTDATSPAPATVPLPETGWSPLEGRILVRISGPGTDKFLQGQFSQHLDEVVPGHSPRAAAATPKGRAYCLTRLVRDGGDILMDLDRETAEATLTQLRKYLMLFRGTSAEVLDEGQITGLLGSATAATLAGDLVAGLEAPGDSIAISGGFLIRVEPTADGISRFEFWQTGPSEIELDASEQRPETDWRASEIAAGIAALTEQTREAFVPQMLNWQHVGGVHFKKGCYTGQEVIARMHFLGQLKKSLYRARLDAATAPQPGTAILAGERSAGTVINALPLANNTCELLAVIRHDAADSELHVAGFESYSLALLPLPYKVPEREKSAPSDT